MHPSALLRPAALATLVALPLLPACGGDGADEGVNGSTTVVVPINRSPSLDDWSPRDPTGAAPFRSEIQGQASDSDETPARALARAVIEYEDGLADTAALSGTSDDFTFVRDFSAAVTLGYELRVEDGEDASSGVGTGTITVTEER